jgi:hypothetical protein
MADASKVPEIADEGFRTDKRQQCGVVRRGARQSRCYLATTGRLTEPRYCSDRVPMRPIRTIEVRRVVSINFSSETSSVSSFRGKARMSFVSAGIVAMT